MGNELPGHKKPKASRRPGERRPRRPEHPKKTQRKEREGGGATHGTGESAPVSHREQMVPRTAHFLSLTHGRVAQSAQLANVAISLSRGGILACPEVNATTELRPRRPRTCECRDTVNLINELAREEI